MGRSLNAGESNVSMRGLLIVAGFSSALLATLFNLAGTVLAQQTDYSAGKTPQQLFSGDCSACHSSPKGLAKNQDQRSLTNFLREHYTTRTETAGALASYLMGNPGTAVPVRNPGAPDPQGRNARSTPASAQPSARPPAPVAPADEDPFRRVFRSITDPDPDGLIATPEPGEGAPGAKPKPGARPRTAARPPEVPGRGKENAKGKKPEASEATRDAKPEEPAKEAGKDAAKEMPKDSPGMEAAKAEAAKAEAARIETAKTEAARAKVRAYASGGEEARPKEATPGPSEPPAVAPSTPSTAAPSTATPSDRPASTPPG